MQAVARLTRSEAVTLMAGGEDTRWGTPDRQSGCTRRSSGRAGARPGERCTSAGTSTPMIWPLAGKHGEPAALALARTEVFRTTDFKLMGFLGGIIASARDTAFLHEEAVSRAGIEHEHRIASRLAQAVLPAKAPVIPNCEVSERTIPALSAGGDFYTHSVIGGDLYFAVGDVAGKGLPAALVMTKVIAACASSFSRHAPERVSDVVADLCDELYPYLSEIGLFRNYSRRQLLSGHGRPAPVQRRALADHGGAGRRRAADSTDDASARRVGRTDRQRPDHHVGTGRPAGGGLGRADRAGEPRR